MSENKNLGSDGKTSHYGSADSPYEVIKIIEHFSLDFKHGSVLKYLLRHGKKDGIRDLEKAIFYLSRILEEEKAKMIKKEEENKWVTVTVNGEIRQISKSAPDAHK